MLWILSIGLSNQWKKQFLVDLVLITILTLPLLVGNQEYQPLTGSLQAVAGLAVSGELLGAQKVISKRRMHNSRQLSSVWEASLREAKIPLALMSLICRFLKAALLLYWGSTHYLRILTVGAWLFLLGHRSTLDLELKPIGALTIKDSGFWGLDSILKLVAPLSN